MRREVTDHIKGLNFTHGLSFFVLSPAFIAFFLFSLACHTPPKPALPLLTSRCFPQANQLLFLFLHLLSITWASPHISLTCTSSVSSWIRWVFYSWVLFQSSVLLSLHLDLNKDIYPSSSCCLHSPAFGCICSATHNSQKRVFAFGNPTKKTLLFPVLQNWVDWSYIYKA